MRNLRAIHRIITVVVVVFTLYLGVTGTLIQLIDLKTLFTHAPATDPNMQAIREGINGGGGFQVISIPDYTAAPLPAGEPLPQLFHTVLQAARDKAGPASLRFLEVRMLDGKPVGQVDIGGKVMRFDARTGAYLGTFPIIRESETPDSQRNTVKHLHRMTTFGDWALIINVVVGLGLLGLIITGVWMYLKILIPRTRAGHTNPFWSGGGAWRSLHRTVSIVCIVFLSIVMFSGLWLAYESLYFGFYMRTHPFVPGQRRADPIAPIQDAAVPSMLLTTLHSYEASKPGVPPRVVRLRFYGGMPQGAVITGGPEATQLVYNAQTGKRVSETEPGYPVSGFPFGWQAHQYAKMLHRGDMFGMTGRMMDLCAGFAMIYLSISGIVMYAQMWSKRRAQGRSALVWS